MRIGLAPYHAQTLTRNRADIMQLVVESFPLMPHAPSPSMNTAHGGLDQFFHQMLSLEILHKRIY